MFQIDWGVKGKISQREVKPFFRKAIAIFLGLQVATLPMFSSKVLANNLPKEYFQDDAPEEVLRAEIFTDARSPIDGKLLTAAEYVELIEKLRSLDYIPPEDLVSPKVREVIDLLRLRKFLRQIIPFIP